MNDGRSFSVQLLCFFNVVCALIGFATVMIGLSYNLNLSDFLRNMDSVHSVVGLTPPLLITMGIVVFATAVFGCYGTLRGNFCLMMTYAIALIIIWILQISWISYIFMQLGDNSMLEQNLSVGLARLFESENELANETVDYIQEKLSCCGLEDSIYKVTVPMFRPKPIIPRSCCSSYVHHVCIPFEQGCWSALYDLIRSRTNAVAIVIGIFAAIELLGASLAIYVAKTYKKSHK